MKMSKAFFIRRIHAIPKMLKANGCANLEKDMCPNPNQRTLIVRNFCTKSSSEHRHANFNRYTI